MSDRSPLDPTRGAAILRPAIQRLIRPELQRTVRKVNRATAGGDRVRVERTSGYMAEPRLELTPTITTASGSNSQLPSPLLSSLPRWVTIANMIPVTGTGTTPVYTNYKYLIPVWFSTNRLIDQITFEITTAPNPAVSVSVALYSSASNGLPYQRVGSAYSFLNISTVGIRYLNYPTPVQCLAGQLYWVFLGFSGNAQIRMGVPAQDILGRVGPEGGHVERSAILYATAGSYQGAATWDYGAMPLMNYLNMVPWVTIQLV